MNARSLCVWAGRPVAPSRRSGSTPVLLPTIPTLVMLTLVLGAALTATAQEDDEDAPANLVRPQFEVQESQFDQMLFQNVQSPKQARTLLEKSLRLHTDDIGRCCQLTEEQRRKLQLAGRGDLKRFFDKVEVVRGKFMLARKDQDKFNQMWQEMSPLQAEFQAGLFDEDSLFRKTLPNTLNQQQFQDYSRYDAERRQFRYRSRVELALSMLENAVPLRDEQRQKIIALVMEQTPPPRQSRGGQWDYQYVLWNMSQLPESTLKPLLDETQWRVLSKQLERVRGMELWFKQNGLLPKDGEPAE